MNNPLNPKCFFYDKLGVGDLSFILCNALIHTRMTEDVNEDAIITYANRLDRGHHQQSAGNRR